MNLHAGLLREKEHLSAPDGLGNLLFLGSELLIDGLQKQYYVIIYHYTSMTILCSVTGSMGRTRLYTLGRFKKMNVAITE